MRRSREYWKYPSRKLPKPVDFPLPFDCNELQTDFRLWYDTESFNFSRPTLSRLVSDIGSPPIIFFELAPIVGTREATKAFSMSTWWYSIVFGGNFTVSVFSRTLLSFCGLHNGNLHYVSCGFLDSPTSHRSNSRPVCGQHSWCRFHHLDLEVQGQCC
jgi:hypothetical protein